MGCTYNPRLQSNTDDTIPEFYGTSLGTGRCAHRRTLGKDADRQGRKRIFASSSYRNGQWTTRYVRNDVQEVRQKGGQYHDAGGERTLFLKSATSAGKTEWTIVGEREMILSRFLLGHYQDVMVVCELSRELELETDD